MSDFPTTPCRSCGAPIRWARTAAGKHIPLDATPTPDGNVLLTEDGVATVVGGLHVWPPDALRWTAHFATCPNADEHRTGR